MSTVDLIDDIAIHHEVALTLTHLTQLCDGSIGYEKDIMVALTVIERELRDAAASMKALTQKIRGCLDAEDRS